MPEQESVTIYDARPHNAVEKTPRHSPEDTERILALLAHYTEKLKTGYDELKAGRQRLLFTHLVMFTLIAVWTMFSFAVIIGAIHDSVYTSLVTVGGGVMMCLYPLYAFSERQYQQERQDRLRALAQRLETLTGWAIQIYEQAERDEIRRLEVNLRLIEVNAYIRQIK